MTTERPNVKPTGRYTARETYTILGISRSTLERQTLKGNLRPMFHKSNMRRLYQGIEILRFWNATY